MSEIIEGLKQKRRKIEQLRQSESRQEGQREQILIQLESEFDVDSVVEAEKMIVELVKEKEEHEKLLKELDEEMDQIICNASPGSNSGTVD